MITFNANPAADATFGDLFTDDVGAATWYRLWVGNGDEGNFVDTSAFNSTGKGWIEASDLDALQADFAQAGDTVLWVKEWNAADGGSAWVGGEVDFSAIDTAVVTEEINGNVPLSTLFEGLDNAADTMYQIWNGDAAGNVGAYLDTAMGNGWVSADKLDDYFYQAEAFAGDDVFNDGFGNFGNNEIWVKTVVDGQNYGWEHWTVDNTYGVVDPVPNVLAGIDLGGDTVGLALNTTDGPLVGAEGGTLIDADDFGPNAAAEVLRITGNADIRIDLTDPSDQVEEMDLNGSGAIAFDGIENDLSGAGILQVQDFTVFDLYSRNPKNHFDLTNNFFGDLEFDGTGFQGDGVNTDGNIVLSGLGSDRIFGGIGNDFIAGGGGSDDVYGGRNADFFFVELSALDPTDGNGIDIFGGSTFDDDASQDSDWVLGEFSDDNEPITVDLAGGDITADSGASASIDEIENFDASGNLYGFLNDLDVVLGGEAEYKAAHAADGTENYGLGSTGQLIVDGTAGDNIIVGGFDNDTIDGDAGDDVLLGGNMQFLDDNQNNPNILNIPNDGRDTIFGGNGDDSILFEIDGGVIEGGRAENNDDDAFVNNDADFDAGNSDTLFLTDHSVGTESNDLNDMTTDNRIRIDLGVGKQGGLANYSGYGGADTNYRDGDYTADQTNYVSNSSRVQVQDMEEVIATGLGSIDYDVDGGNELIDDPADHNFTDRMNFFGINEDLDLRGTDGDNILYANTGDDIIEGRTGDDMLSGGGGNDDFIFQLAGESGNAGGDDLDIIHRQQDDNLDNFWDEDADGDVLYTRDFNLDPVTTPSNSILSLYMLDTSAGADPLAPLADIPVQGILFQLGGESYNVNSLNLAASVDYDAFIAELRVLFAADAALDGLVVDDYDAALPGSIIITDPAGGVFVAEGYSWLDGIVPPAGDIEWNMTIGDPDLNESEDRIIFAAYEDRADGELVDDDGFVNETGDAVTLGRDGYAEDLVVRFDSDGNGTTVLAEDQQWDLDFENLADEDTVTISVNGTAFTLQMGVAADGTAIEENVEEFLQRMQDLINAGSDNDTLAGSLAALYVAGADVTQNGTIQLTQADYYTGQVAFMDRPVVTLGNASGGEPASVTISNLANSEITLFEFDGRNNELDEANVLFLGGSGMNDGVVTNADNSRAILETAADAGGALNGSDALVVDSMTDVDTIATDFSLHGDDLLFTGIGDDVVTAGTGDDRIFGSVGTDTVDGGKDLWVVQTLVAGEVVETVETLNDYEAAQRLAEADIVAVDLLEEDDAAGDTDGFVDQLIFSTADFSGTQFTITVDDDLAQMEGGAGTVGVDEGDDGIIDHETTFVEMEAIRTLAGDGTHAGQGNDTLNVEALSDAVNASDLLDPDAAVVYNMTSDLGFVQINADLNGDGAINADPALYVDANNDGVDDVVDGADEIDNFLAVDGVERLIGGNANEQLNIDESEVNKDNYFDGDDEVTAVGDLVGDSIVYDHTDMDNQGGADDNGDIDDDNDGIIDIFEAAPPNDAVAVTMRPSLEIVVESASETDLVNMTGGTIVGSDTTTDTLIDVETINVGNAAISALLDDTINASNINGAYVDYAEGKVGTSDADVDDLVMITGMTQMEVVEGSTGADTVVVADTMTNYRAYDSANATTAISYASFLDYDTDFAADGTRVAFNDLTAAQRAEANNQTLFQFDLTTGQDRVDYANESGDIAAVVDLEDAVVAQTVFVDQDGAGADTFDLEGEFDRIDLLQGVEQVVASQGDSILDFTGSDTNLAISYMAAADSSASTVYADTREHIISIEDLDSSIPFGDISYVELMDDADGDAVVGTTALWNVIEGSDNEEKVELTDDQSADVHIFNLRGGANEVNYNELTKGIELSFANDAAVNTNGVTTATITAKDTAGTVIPADFDTITTYNSNRTDGAVGSLRIEASQSENDTIDLAAITNSNVILLGATEGLSDVINVTFSTDSNDVEMVLTGFEALVDGAGDDEYVVDDLSNFLDTLALIDSDEDADDTDPADIDTLVLTDGALEDGGLTADYSGANPTIDMESLEDDISTLNGAANGELDFDILDVRQLTEDGLTLQNTGAGVEAGETVIVGDLSLVDTVNDFAVLALSDDATAGGVTAETSFIFSLDDDELQNNLGGVLVALEDAVVTTLDTTRIAADVTIVVEDDAAAGATVIAGDGDDSITGGAGADSITGGAGDDTLSGGVSTEVRQFNIEGILDAVGGQDFQFDFMSQGNLTLDEGVDFVDGAGNDAVGAALAAQLNGDLAQVNTDFDTAIGGLDGAQVEIASVTYNSDSNLLTFTFVAGADEAGAIDLGITDTDTGTFAVSAETVVADGGDGGVDTFLFTDDNGTDTINDFIVASDILNFAGITGITAATEQAIAANAAAVAGTDGGTHVFADGADGTGAEAIADYTDLTDVAAFLEAGINATSAHNYIAVINDLTTDTAYAYQIDVNAVDVVANQIDAGDISLIGVVNADTALTVVEIA